jgi:ADP-L-glycero-D-manno-heptose 6-epimerase
MYVVTGGAGFIGSAMVWQLNRQGIHRILVVDELGQSEKWRNLAPLTFLDYIHKDQFLALIEKDEWLERPQAIIHLGACSSTTELDVDYLWTNNYRYTRTLAEWCLARDVRFLYASSAATYGDGSQAYSDDESQLAHLRPLNPYGYSKQRFDQWARESGALARIAGFKFFNVFGPNEYHKQDMVSMVYQAFHQIRATGVVRLFKSDRPDYSDGGQQRDFVYVKDCIDVLWWFLEHPRVAGLFNLGAGRARTWNDLATAAFSALSLPPRIEYIDMPSALVGRYQYFTQADMTKLRQVGYATEFTSLNDAVRDYIVNYLATDDPYLRKSE